MSSRITSLAWRFPHGGPLLLGLLALADFADDEGLLTHSVKQFAAKLRCSERQARRVLHDLLETGYVAVVGKPGGAGATRQYRIHLELLGATADTRDTYDGDGTDVTHVRTDQPSEIEQPEARNAAAELQELSSAVDSPAREAPDAVIDDMQALASEQPTPPTNGSLAARAEAYLQKIKHDQEFRHADLYGSFRFEHQPRKEGAPT